MRRGTRGEELLLRGGIGKPARERLARIVESVRHELLAFAAPGERDLDPVPAARRKRRGEQSALAEIVRHEDEPRRRLVVIELREECLQYVAGSQRAVGLGKIGAIAPVLAGAEEEDLDAAVAPLLMHGKDVGLLDRPGIDALMRLDR